MHSPIFFIKNRTIPIFLLFLVAFVLSFHQVTDLDVWTNLASGRWMWEHHQILTRDIFSYPYFGAPWINHQWVSQIFTHLAYQAGGPTGLIVGRCALMLTALAILWKLCRRRVHGGLLITCFVLWVGVFAMSERILERAHLISLLFVALYLWIIERWMEIRGHDPISILKWGSCPRISKPLAALAVLQVCWANVHGGFVLGPMLVTLGWLGIACNEACKGFWKDSRWAAVVALLSGSFLLALSCVNPFGWEIFGFVKAQTTSTIVRTTVVEWLKPFAPGPGVGNWERWFCGGTLSLFLCACAAVMVRWDAKRFLWAMLGVGIFFSARRHADLLVFLTAPFIVDNLTRAFGARPVQRSAWIKAGHMAFMALALTSAWWVGTNRFWISGRALNRFGLGVSDLAYPTEAADFIQAHRLRPNLFHNYNCGSYLAYRFFGLYPVFIDGRNLVYSDAFLQDYYRLFLSLELFDKAVERYGIRSILLLHRLDGGNGFTKRLWQDKRWRLAHLDAQAAVFVADIPEHQSIPDIRPLDAHAHIVDEKGQGHPVKKLLLADFFYRMGDLAGTEILLKKALEEYPNDADGHFLMGFLKKDQKDEASAKDHWRRAARWNRCSWQAQFQQGLLCEEEGAIKEARTAYQNALFLSPQEPAILHNLIVLECREARWERAKSLAGELSVTIPLTKD